MVKHTQTMSATAVRVNKGITQDILTFHALMLKNDQTYFKNIVLLTLQVF